MSPGDRTPHFIDVTVFVQFWSQYTPILLGDIADAFFTMACCKKASFIIRAINIVRISDDVWLSFELFSSSSPVSNL